MGSESVSAYRGWIDAIGFCLVLVGGIEAFYAGKPWRVYLPYLFAGLFFFVLGEKGSKINAIIIDTGPWGRLRRINKQQAAELANTLRENSELRNAIAAPSLEIRPLPGKELQSFRELRGYTHYRMEIYNSDTETAHNVQVRLVGIEPRPVCQQFCADFPYVVRLAHLEGETDASVSRDINPRTSQSFELLFFWKSSDHRTMVNGIDTKHALSRDACFSIEDKECWHLQYEVSSATTGIQRPSFLMRCEGNNLVMRRLI